MPAIEVHSDARTAADSSLASEIVELIVVTRDAELLQTLRAAAGRARRVWHVPSADKAADLLLAGDVGILVLDVATIVGDRNAFAIELKRQFPDLVVVLAGSREAESAMAALLSDGTAYRFLHKPVSPGRARSFADAAVKRHCERRSIRPRPGPVEVAGRRRIAWIALLTAAAAVAVAALVALSRR
ncbi:MAG: hypothetical protein KGL34_13745 [Gammaproteobacteria bacterium]|nr:hypothetical protein [Gammaproteobacteria bacterium]